LAAGTGTSARLLVYHFGSKDGLIQAVMNEVRARLQTSFAATVKRSARGSAEGILRAFWASILRPANARLLKLLFEVQVLALQNPRLYARYLEGTSSSWLTVIEAAVPPGKQRRVVATLGAAVIDGLLLEYLSTGDRRRTTDALDLFSRAMSGREWKA
jgi:AcrR family transcriptional regulator